MKHWLMKTEPGTYSIQDLASEKKQTTTWEGVRNYQARNLLRDEVRRGDRVLIYHSGKEPAVVGTAKVVKSGYPDHFAFDPKHRYYDPKSDPDNPRWYMVDVKLEHLFDRVVTLAELRDVPQLKNMQLLRKGNRLSIQPVTKPEFEKVIKLAAK